MVGSAIGIAGIGCLGGLAFTHTTSQMMGSSGQQQANAAFQASQNQLQNQNALYDESMTHYSLLLLNLPDCEIGYEHAMYLTGPDREDLNLVIVSLYTKMNDLTKQIWSLFRSDWLRPNNEGWEMYVSFKDPGDYMQIDLIHNSENIKIERILPPESI